MAVFRWPFRSNSSRITQLEDRVQELEDILDQAAGVMMDVTMMLGVVTAKVHSMDGNEHVSDEIITRIRDMRSIYEEHRED